MRFWVDEQLSPALAGWIHEQFGVAAVSVRELGLARAKDRDIFAAARSDDAIVMTKDQDFVRLLRQLGPPPRVLWITLGNTSNARLRTALQASLRGALDLFVAGEPLVEIRDAAIAAVVRP